MARHGLTEQLDRAGVLLCPAAELLATTLEFGQDPEDPEEPASHVGDLHGTFPRYTGYTFGVESGLMNSTAVDSVES
jgi:hypothetical protein